MQPPSDPLLLLPTKPAQWTIWVSVSLSVSLYFLLLWLQVDTLLPKELSGKLSILLLAAIPVFLGALMSLYFVASYAVDLKKKLDAELNKSYWEHTP